MNTLSAAGSICWSRTFFTYKRKPVPWDAEQASFLNDIGNLDAPPAFVGAQNLITPPFEYDKYFFPQKEWILDAVNEKIVPLEGYVPVTNCTVAEQMRKLKLGV